MTNHTISPSIFVSSPFVEKNQENQNCDFQDIGYMRDTVTFTMTVTLGDLHRLYCMSPLQCRNVIQSFAATLAPDHLVYNRQPSEEDALIPNIEDAVIDRVRQSIAENQQKAEAEKERFREYGRMGGRPRKDKSKPRRRTTKKTVRKPRKTTGAKSKKPSVQKPSENTKTQVQKPRVFSAVNNCEQASNETLSTHACAHTRIYKSEERIYKEGRRGSCSESLNADGDHPAHDMSDGGTDSARGLNQRQAEAFSSGDVSTQSSKVNAGRQAYVKTRVKYPEVTWPTKTNASVEEMLLAITTPGDRRWHTLTISYKRGGGSKEVWETWSRREEHFDKEWNDMFWDSIDMEPESGLERKITIDTLRGAYWHGLSTVRPFMGATGVFYDRSAKQNGGKIANGASKRGENNEMAVASGHAVFGEGDVGETEPVRIPKKADLIQRGIEYLKNRGFTMETIEKFHFQGTWHKATGRPAIRMPFPGQARHLKYRFIDSEPNSRNGQARYWESAGETLNYNEPRLGDASAKVVFFVEGEFDAASVEQAGYAAIAVHKLEKLSKALDEYDVDGKRFIVLRDNDATGEAKGDDVAGLLNRKGLPYSVHAMPDGFNDANAYLMQYGTVALRDRLREFIDEDEANNPLGNGMDMEYHDIVAETPKAAMA